MSFQSLTTKDDGKRKTAENGTNPIPNHMDTDMDMGTEIIRNRYKIMNVTLPFQRTSRIKALENSLFSRLRLEKLLPFAMVIA